MTWFAQSFLTRKTSNPKTVLGFYGTVLGLGLLACTSIIAVLATTGAAVWLIPWIAGFGGLLLLLLFTGVFVINIIDTSKLMLSPVSGTEYSAIQQGVVLGDSLTGPRLISAADINAPLLSVDALTPEPEDSNG